jgi:predicted amidophosphoribosyltransferase
MWPVEHLLVKRAETPPMGAMGARHRRACARLELSGALEVAPGALATLAGARVLLVDDVCASGHTLLSAAAVLRRCGASEVTGLVVARAFLRAGPWAAGP